MLGFEINQKKIRIMNKLLSKLFLGAYLTV